MFKFQEKTKNEAIDEMLGVNLAPSYNGYQESAWYNRNVGHKNWQKYYNR